VHAFEFPLNEKFRSYLRADELLRRLTALGQSDDPLHHHFGLQTLFELQDMLNRTDIKGDLIRDLERNRTSLMALRNNEKIEQTKLEEVLSEVVTCYERLTSLGGKPGQGLGEIDWISAVRGRISIPAGTCGFDLPVYQFWQRQPAHKRQSELQSLQGYFESIQKPITFVLNMVRQSGESLSVVAESGSLQYAIPNGRLVQLLRLSVTDDVRCIPEISANRLNIAIRWMNVSDEYRLTPHQQDVSFRLSLCN
jgi:cell division protein ZapD